MKLPRIYKDDSADVSKIESFTIAIIGYGNQAQAHALNLKDSGMQVLIGLREKSSNRKRAEDDGLRVSSIEDAVDQSQIIALLVPDQEMGEAYKIYIAPYIKKDQYLLFAHGYNIHYGRIEPPKDVNIVLSAPSAAGTELRRKFKDASGVPGVFAIHHDYSGDSKDIILAYSKAIGLTRVGMVETSFKEETETDLFGEQAILTGGLPRLMQLSYKVLLEGGYDSAVAWLVCYFELKTIVDVFHKKGFEYLYNVISGTAEYGGITRGKRLVNEDTEKELKKILYEIQNGEFHKEWMKESGNNLQKLQLMRKEEADDPLETMGKYMLKEFFEE